jgi:hypothetical protein
MLQVACDPAGGQKDTSGLSFVERIILESLRIRTRAYDEEIADKVKRAVSSGMAPDAALEGAMLDTPRAKAVVPLYKDLYAKNRHDQRRLALRTLLTQAKFSKSNGAGRIRLAMKHYRFSEPGDKATSQPAPIHDQWSHLVTACEYMAVFIGLNVIGGFYGATADAKPSQTRNQQRGRR